MVSNLSYIGESNRHQRYQLSRFLILMNNYDQAMKASETATNSAGSAMRENEKYLQSYEAKINKVKNAWTEATLNMGESFLGDALVGATMAGTTLINTFSAVVDKVGLLPMVFGAAGIAILAFNKTGTQLMGLNILNFLGRIPEYLKNVTGAYYGSAIAARNFGVANATMATTAKAQWASMVVSVKALGSSIKSALTHLSYFAVGALAPIAGFLALGVAISFLTKKWTEAKQKQEDYQKSMDTSTDSVTKKKDDINELVDSYDKLSKLGSSRDNEQEEEYVRIQNELATLLPVVKAGEDSKGNAILLNADATRDYVAILEKRIALEKEKALNEAPEKIAEQVKKIAEYKAHIASLKGEVDKLSNQAKQWEDKGQNADGILNNINQLKTEILDYEVKVVSAEGKLKSFSKTLADGVKGNKDSGWISEQASKLNFDVDKTEKLTEKVKSIRKELGKGFSLEGIDASQLDKLKEKLDETADKTGWSTNEWKKFGHELSKFDIKDTASVLGYLRNSQNDLKKSAEENNTTLKDSVPVFSSLGEIMGWHANNVISVSDAYEENTEVTEANLSVQDQLLKKYQETADQVEPMNKLLEDMANGKRITAAEAMELIAKEEQLAEVISVENGQVKVNTEALAAMRDGAIDAYSQKMEATQNDAIATANTTISNLNNYGLEIQAIKSVADAKKSLAQADEEMAMIDGMGDMNQRKKMYDERDTLSGLVNLMDTIENLKGLAGSALPKVGTELEKNARSSDKAKKATKEKADQDKKSKYIADAYALAQANVTYELKKQQSIQSRYPIYSKKYQQALQKEIDLLTMQETLLKEKAKDLEGQIKSGNIKQYGVITEDGNGYTSSGSSSGSGGSYDWSGLGGKLKGTGHLFEKYGNASGINPAFLAAIAKHESGNGTSNGIKNKNNAFGIMLTNGQGQRTFKSLEESIKYTADMLKRLYTSKGKDSIPDIAKMYAPVGAKNDPGGLNAHWQKRVGEYLAEFGGGGVTSSGKGSYSSSSASNKAANYYLENFVKSSHFGDTKGRDTPHQGLDFKINGANNKGRAGDPIKAVMGGKVTVAGYSDTAGNWVVIQQDDGKVAKYMHMLKTPDVKAGQKVKANQKIGNIGDTGDSHGNHLHLQIEKNGKAIDPEKYLNDLSKGTAEAEKSIDDAKLELVETQIELLDKQNEKWNKQEQMQLSKIAEVNRKYDPKIEKLTYEYDHRSEKLNREVGGTKKYNDEQRKQIKNMTDRQNLIKKNREELQKLMKTEKFSEQVTDDLNTKLNDMSLEYQGLQTQIYAANKAIVDSNMLKAANEIADLDYKINRNEELLSREPEASKEYNKVLSDQIKLLEKRGNVLLNERKDINNALSGNKLSKPDKQEITEQQRRNSLDYQANLTQLHEKSYARLNGTLAKYSKYQSEINYKYEHQEKLKNRLVMGTWDYRNALNNQLIAATKVSKSIYNERQEIIKSFKTEKLSLAQKEELTNRLNELSLAYQDQIDTINNINLDRANNTIAKHRKELDKLMYTIERNQKILSRINIDDGITKEYLDLQNEIIRDKKIEAEKILAERQDIIKELTASTADMKGLPSKQEQQKNLGTAEAQRNHLQKQLMNEATKKQKEIDKKHKELEKLKKAIPKAKNNAEKKKLQAEFDALKKAVDADKKNADKEIDKKKKELDKLQKKIDDLNKSIKNDYKTYIQLTPAQREEKLGQLDEKSLEYQDVLNEIYELERQQVENNKQIADDIIQTWKDAYAKQKEIALATYDAETKAMDEAYEKKMEKMDKEVDEYEKSIQKKISALDKLREEELYEKDIGKRNKEIAKIQNKIDLLALDKSYEAQAERAKLEEELAERKDELSETQKDHEIKTRKESLQQQLDDYKEQKNKEKKIEEENYKKSKELRDKERKEIERGFDEQIANERYWAKIHKEIMEGNVDNVRNAMQEFLDDFAKTNEETAKELELSWQELLNLIDKVNKATGSIGGVSTLPENQVKELAELKSSLFDDYAKAKKLADALTNDYKGQNTRIVEEDGKWRVLSYFEDMERAQTVLDRVKKLGYMPSAGSIGAPSSPSAVYEVKTELYKTQAEAQKIMDALMKDYKAMNAYIQKEASGWYRVYGAFDNKSRADDVLQRLKELYLSDYGAVYEKNPSYQLKTQGMNTLAEAQKLVDALKKDYGAMNAYTAQENGKYVAYGSFDSQSRANDVMARIEKLYKVVSDSANLNGSNKGLVEVSTQGFSTKDLADKLANALRSDHQAQNVRVGQENGVWKAYGSFENASRANQVLEDIKKRGFISGDTPSTSQKPESNKMYKYESGSFKTRAEAQKIATLLTSEYNGQAVRVHEYGRDNYTAIANYQDKDKADRVLLRLKELYKTSGKITQYHEGGIVGDKPKTKLGELANKLFNTKPNEQIIKSLKGELQIPPQNIPNIFDNVRNLAKALSTQQTAVVDSGTVINQMDVHIGNIAGGEQGMKQMFKHIETQMIRRGR